MKKVKNLDEFKDELDEKKLISNLEKMNNDQDGCAIFIEACCTQYSQ